VVIVFAFLDLEKTISFSDSLLESVYLVGFITQPVFKDKTVVFSRICMVLTLLRM
jgi:hypothetical protein